MGFFVSLILCVGYLMTKESMLLVAAGLFYIGYEIAAMSLRLKKDNNKQNN